MSDHSARGYRRFRCFFGGLLKRFSLISVQTQADAERFLAVCPTATVEVFGNMKFDQSVPENIADPGLAECFGNGDFTVLLAASTHPGEEEVVVKSFLELRQDNPDLRLVLVPRHAERGEDIAEMLERYQIPYCRRSLKEVPAEPVQVLLADTTGEMFKFIKFSDVVIMGKSLAGHDEGHNLIEPALLDKPIVTGAVLRNFRFILQVLCDAQAVVTVSEDADLTNRLERLITDREFRLELGKRAGDAIRCHRGATDRTVNALESMRTVR
jgi:3-deoxy-D-manno-octulosonic-acid transferase